MTILTHLRPKFNACIKGEKGEILQVNIFLNVGAGK